MLKITNKKRFAMFVLGAAVVAGGIGFAAYKVVKNYRQTPAIERMSINEAAKIGEKKTVQLLVQIAPAKSEGRLERGDVVLSAPEDKQFSIAEKEGFLIIKIRLTESEEQLMALALNEQKGIFANEEDRAGAKQLKRRKFSVDLSKIGIGADETRGKVIADKVFEDDVLLQKESK